MLRNHPPAQPLLATLQAGGRSAGVQSKSDRYRARGPVRHGAAPRRSPRGGLLWVTQGQASMGRHQGGANVCALEG